MKIYKEFGRDPHVDWITILALSVIIALSLAFVGFSLYNAVVEGKIVSKDLKNASYTKPDEEIISKVNDIFKKRGETSKKARSAYSGAADPSI